MTWPSLSARLKGPSVTLNSCTRLGKKIQYAIVKGRSHQHSKFHLDKRASQRRLSISGATWSVLFVKQNGDRVQRLTDFLTGSHATANMPLQIFITPACQRDLCKRQREKLNQSSSLFQLANPS